jgi:hypothetical protein
MSKYYRVKKDTFLWKEGAILKNSATESGYQAVEEIWDAIGCIGGEYISKRIIECEENKEWFERVYPDTITGKLYKTKDQLLAIYKDAFVKVDN